MCWQTGPDPLGEQVAASNLLIGEISRDLGQGVALFGSQRSRGFSSSGTISNVKGIKPLVEPKWTSATEYADTADNTHYSRSLGLEPLIMRFLGGRNKTNWLLIIRSQS